MQYIANTSTNKVLNKFLTHLSSLVEWRGISRNGGVWKHPENVFFRRFKEVGKSLSYVNFSKIFKFL